MSFLNDLFTIAAPILGTAFGGPAGGLAAGAIVQQINRPPAGGIAPPPTFATAPSQEPPSFFSQLGTALLPVAGALLTQELTPNVPTTLIADPQGLLGGTTTAGTFTSAQREAQINAARASAGLTPLAAGFFGTAAGVPLSIGTMAGTVARALIKVAENPLLGSTIGTAAGIAGLEAVQAVRGTSILGGQAVSVAPLGQRILRGDVSLNVLEAAAAREGGTRRQTVVQTVNVRTGQVVRSETFRGAPFLMNRDIVIAKKVFRLAQKLHGRLPRRTVKRRVIDCPPIGDFIQQRALSHVLQSPK